MVRRRWSFRRVAGIGVPSGVAGVLGPGRCAGAIWAQNVGIATGAVGGTSWVTATFWLISSSGAPSRVAIVPLLAGRELRVVSPILVEANVLESTP
jgi:hypothetical protein